MTIDGIQGCGTALVTPFTDAGELDLESFAGLVEWQIEEGIDFLVPCGTTGETPTLEPDEYKQVIATCLEAARSRVPIVAGAGGNNTRRVCHLAQIASGMGVEAILSVTPYYNKPTQRGLFEHFSAVATASACPVILYNVPGRTGVNIAADTTLRLASVPNIVGIKEASGNLPQIMEIARHRPHGFRLLSGDDNLALLVNLLGGDGLISVASNVIPRQMSEMLRLARDNDVAAAREIHYRLLDLMNLNFVETSPIPVKYALSRLGKIHPNYRLPLHPPSTETQRRMDTELTRLGLVP